MIQPPSDISLEDLELLLEANRLLSSKLEIAELLYAIMDLAGRVMKVEAGSVLLLDEKRQELYFDVAVGGAGESIKGVRVPLGSGIAGWVAKEGKPVVANDVTKDPRWQGGLAAGGQGFVTKAIMALPLCVKGRTIGVVEAINKINCEEFTSSEQRLFEAFASQAAVAIENARLFSDVRQEKQKIEELFNRMAEGALVAGASGQILKMNDCAAAWLSGAAPVNLGELASQGFEWSPTLDQVLSDGAAKGNFELRREKPQPLILAGSWSRWEDPLDGQVQTIFVFQDVTQSRKEEMLQRNFLSMISHKLRTPLVAITGYMPFLRQNLPATPVLRRAVDAMDRESRHLAYLVEDLLKFTMISGIVTDAQLVKSKVLASRLMEDALAKIDPLAKAEEVAIEKNFDSSASINGDSGLLTDMMHDLMENAIRFNTKSSKRLTVSVQAQDGHVVISVADNGPGIPPEEQDRVFQRFHQIEEDFTGQVRGMGLGLSFVKKVVELHRGRIDLESRPGEGTTFTVMLPATP